MSNTYLMGAMLDPLVVEFMSPAYCEARLEAKIRTDEIRGNCPPRAGYVCVLDPRVKTGRYYRKHVEGEGVNALPPSRIEKALTQQEQRSQKGEGISFLGKAAIAGGLAVGGLAAIGAISNSGRSQEAVPDIPNAKAKPPNTSVKPKSSTYEEARESAEQEAKQKIDPDIPYAEPRSFDDEIDQEIAKVWANVEKLRQEMGIPPSERSPDAAKRKRGGNPKSDNEIQAEIDNASQASRKKRSQEQVATTVQKTETLKQPTEVTTRSPDNKKPWANEDIQKIAQGILKENKPLPPIADISRFPDIVRSSILEKTAKYDKKTTQQIIGLATYENGFTANEIAKALNLKDTRDENLAGVRSIRLAYGIDKESARSQKLGNEPVPLTKNIQSPPNPEVSAAPKNKKEKKAPKPPVDVTTAQGLSHTVLKDGYTAIADVAGGQNIGYKSGGQLRQKLGEGGVIRNERLTENKADFEALLDNSMLVEKGYLVQTKAGYGGYGKGNVSMVRVPAFMPVKDFSNATSNIISEGKGGAGITDRIERAESLVAAINEKMNKSDDLPDKDRAQLTGDRIRLTDKINKDKEKIQGSTIAETNKPTGTRKAKVEAPVFKSPAAQKIVGLLGSDIKEIGQNFINKYREINEQIYLIPPSEMGAMANYFRGLDFNKKGVNGAASNRTSLANRLEYLKDHPVSVVVKKPVAPVVSSESYDLGKDVSSAPSKQNSGKPVNEKYTAARNSQRASNAVDRAEDTDTANKAAAKVLDTVQESGLEGLNKLEGNTKVISFFRKHSTTDQKNEMSQAISKLNAQTEDSTDQGFYKDIHERLTGKKKLPKAVSDTSSAPQSPVTSTVNPLAETSKQAEAIAPPKAQKQKTEKTYPSDYGDWGKRPSLPTQNFDKKATFTELGWNVSDASYFSQEFKNLQSDELKLFRVVQMANSAQNPDPKKAMAYSYEDVVNLAARVMKTTDTNKVETMFNQLDNYSLTERERAVSPTTLILRGGGRDQKILSEVGRIKKEDMWSKMKEYGLEQESYSSTGLDYSYNPSDFINRMALYNAMYDQKIATKKQNNDAIAPHETYYSAREQAKRDALRRFAA